MDRIGYSEDEDFPGQFELWDANCRRSLQGKAGQAALRELEAALLALPKKRLIAGVLESESGDVCAVGALKRYKGVERTTANPDYDMEGVGVELGMPRLVAWKVVCVNDLESAWISRGYLLCAPVAPEERYQKVLAWVRQQIAQPSASSDDEAAPSQEVRPSLRG